MYSFSNANRFRKQKNEYLTYSRAITGWILLVLLFLLSLLIDKKELKKKITDMSVPRKEQLERIKLTASHTWVKGKIIRHVEEVKIVDFKDKKNLHNDVSDIENLNVPVVENLIENTSSKVIAETKIVQPEITFDTRPPDVLLIEARQILSKPTGPYDQAFSNLRSIILLQSNEISREAREILGYAYEKTKQYDKAKSEYASYLNLYTENNADRTRVRQRLMALEILEPTEGANVKREPRVANSWDFNGAISQYFYTSSDAASTRLIHWNPNEFNSLTGVQLTLVRDYNQYKILSKIRYNKLHNFYSKNGNRSSLSSAYIDFEDIFKQYAIRAGRQSSVAGAVTRFDGVSSRYTINSNMEISLAIGRPYVGKIDRTSRKFIGIELNRNINSDWSITSYINRQTADKLVERNAIGVEARYRSNDLNSILHIEYDSIYNSFNQISFQGNKYVGDYEIFSLYDRRRSPMPYGDIALGIGLLAPNRRSYISVKELVEDSGLSSSQIYNYISNSSPYANSFVIGTNIPINKKWSTNINFQTSNISTLPGFRLDDQFEPIPVQVGQKNNYSATVHFRGENVLYDDTSSEIVAGKTIGNPNSKFLAFTNNYRFGENKKNNLALMIRYDDFDLGYERSNTISGSLRGIYTLGKNGNLELQYSRDIISKSNLENKSSYNTNQTFYIGYRKDF